MIRLGALLAAIIASILLWHECGEDICVFCYRIGLGALTMVRSHALVPVPAYIRNVARKRTACSNRSGICSTPSTTSRD